MTPALLLVLSLVTWIGLRGGVGPSALVVAAIVCIALWRGRDAALRGESGPRAWWRRTVAAVEVIVLFFWQLVAANWQQTRLVLSPSLDLATRWIRYRSALTSPAARAALALLVSLTPGTLVAQVDDEGLLIHVLLRRGGDLPATEEQIRRLEEPLARLQR